MTGLKLKGLHQNADLHFGAAPLCIAKLDSHKNTHIDKHKIIFIRKRKQIIRFPAFFFDSLQKSITFMLKIIFFVKNNRQF